MTRTAMFAAAVAIALVGCFDSVVSDPCIDGFAWRGGACRPTATGPDAGALGTTDAGGDAHGRDSGARDASVPIDSGAIDSVAIDAGTIDALTCPLPEIVCGAACIDPTDDANNCGHCGHVCASGICHASMCVGDAAGHVVAIGHDYAHFHPAMARVLGNALALRAAHTVRVAWYRGTASETVDSDAHVAAQQALAAMGNAISSTSFATPPTTAQLASEDVVVIEAQSGDGDAVEAIGAAWAPTAQTYLAATGVIVVLEGAGGVSYRFADGAGLFTVGAPVDESGTALDVVGTTDAVAQDVTSPYLGEASTISWPGAPAAVVATPAGDVVVFHETF